MATSERQFRSAQILLLMILFQIPVFRTPCRSGVCESPLEVVVGQLKASKMVSDPVSKAILYPGAILRNWRAEKELLWSTVLEDYNMTSFAPRTGETDYRLEVLMGSFFLLGGSIVGLVKPGRLTVMGLLLIAWGLFKEGLFEPPDEIVLTSQVQLRPSYFAALILSILSLSFDRKKVERVVEAVTPASSRQPPPPSRGKGKQKLKFK